MPIGLKGNSDGSGAIQIGGSDAISISTGLNTTFAGTVTATGTVAGTTGTLYPIVSDTAKSATGTSVDFTGIPSWVKRITVMFNGVSTNGTSIVQVRLGTSSGFVSTGYSGRGDRFLSTGTAANIFTSSANSTGFNLEQTLATGAGALREGIATICLVSGNTWVLQSYYGVTLGESAAGTGALNLGGTLTQVRITTVNGTDTFDAGTINILYE